ncbi:MAG: ACP S-malonyltransferase [Deltaproteobacteria bacterium]|nr:ACP S-malonyltransferase [Deltaproteobacteria bacterium]
MIGFIFPGQGSQEVGMGREFVENFAAAREIFEEADDTLGFALSRLCFEGPEERLLLTEFTQPAILTTSIAMLRVLEGETGLRPSLVAGHSLGEYSALVAAGVFQFEDALRAVRNRGLFMQEAVPVGTGGMAAILGMENEALEEVCRQAAQGEVVAPANYNSPGQIVIAGHCGALQRAMTLCRERGCRKAVPLPVSAPFHSVLMAPAGERLRPILEDIPLHPFKVPLVSNVEGAVNQDAARVRELLIEQVSRAVLWEGSVRAMILTGIDRFLEIGPGRVLTGLVKRIDKQVSTHAVDSVQGLKALVS